MSSDRILAALAPFAACDREIRRLYVVRGDDHVMVQIGGVRLTWGMFKAATEAMRELQAKG